MNDEETISKLDEWIAAWCEERITAEEMRELEDLLRDDEAAQTRFAEAMSVRNILEGMGSDMPMPAFDRIVAFHPAARRRVWRMATLAAAAAVILTFVVTAMFMPRSVEIVEVVEATQTIEAERDVDGFAILTHAVGAVFPEAVKPLREGAILRNGRIQLEKGLLHMQFYNGVKLVLEGPADFEILAMDEAFCWEGKFHASVPLHAQGFIVHTPVGEIIDHGTEYGLEVNADGSSEVHVFEGEVEVRDTREEMVASLSPGEAARIDQLGRRLPLIADDGMFASDEELVEWHALEVERQFQQWYQRSRQWRNHPSLLAWYDFDDRDFLSGTVPSLSSDPYSAEHPGLVVGGRQTEGRWPGKAAIAFSRPSDRIRVRVPGFHDTLTLSAWVRIDDLENRDHGLILSDGFDPGAVHWSLDGRNHTLRLDTITDQGVEGSYASEPVVSPDLVGQWIHLVTTWDRVNGRVSHFLNGEPIGSQQIAADTRLRIGVGEIGNWGASVNSNALPERNFNGVIDEFAVYSDAFTPEVVARMAELEAPRLAQD